MSQLLRPVKAALLGLCVVLIGQVLANAQPVGGDVARGRAIYADNCASCHSIGKSDDDTMLSLSGVADRKAGAVADFAYSPALMASGLTWTPEALDAYIASPTKAMPGSQMYFVGLPSPQDRADVIAYLATLK